MHSSCLLICLIFCSQVYAQNTTRYSWSSSSNNRISSQLSFDRSAISASASQSNASLKETSGTLEKSSTKQTLVTVGTIYDASNNFISWTPVLTSTASASNIIGGSQCANGTSFSRVYFADSGQPYGICPGTEVLGDDGIAIDNIRSAESCARSCDHNQTCVAASLHIDSRIRYLKCSRTSLVPRRGVDSIVKLNSYDPPNSGTTTRASRLTDISSTALTTSCVSSNVSTISSFTTKFPTLSNYSSDTSSIFVPTLSSITGNSPSGVSNTTTSLLSTNTPFFPNLTVGTSATTTQLVRDPNNSSSTNTSSSISIIPVPPPATTNTDSRVCLECTVGSQSGVLSAINVTPTDAPTVPNSTSLPGTSHNSGQSAQSPPYSNTTNTPGLVTTSPLPANTSFPTINTDSISCLDCPISSRTTTFPIITITTIDSSETSGTENSITTSSTTTELIGTISTTEAASPSVSTSTDTNSVESSEVRADPTPDVIETTSETTTSSFTVSSSVTANSVSAITTSFPSDSSNTVFLSSTDFSRTPTISPGSESGATTLSSQSTVVSSNIPTALPSIPGTASFTLTQSFASIVTSTIEASTTQSSASSNTGGPVTLASSTNGDRGSGAPSFTTTTSSTGSTSTTRGVTLIDPVCTADLSEGFRDGTNCDQCPVIIENTLEFAPPVICYEEVIIATVYTFVDSLGQPTRYSTNVRSRSAVAGETHEITLHDADTPRTPAIVVSVSILKGINPCYVLTNTFTNTAIASPSRLTSFCATPTSWTSASTTIISQWDEWKNIPARKSPAPRFKRQVLTCSTVVSIVDSEVRYVNGTASLAIYPAIPTQTTTEQCSTYILDATATQAQLILNLKTLNAIVSANITSFASENTDTTEVQSSTAIRAGNVSTVDANAPSQVSAASTATELLQSVLNSLPGNAVAATSSVRGATNDSSTTLLNSVPISDIEPQMLSSGGSNAGSATISATASSSTSTDAASSRHAKGLSMIWTFIALLL